MRLPSLLLLALLLVPATCAADGIPLGKSFPIPYTVSGMAVPAKAIVSQENAGQYRMRVFYYRAGEVVEAIYTLDRSSAPGPAPEPGPDPSPGPAPVPDPPKNLWAIVVEESSERTPDQAAVLLSKEVRASVSNFRIVDRDVISDDVKPYAERAQGSRLPVLFLVDDGQVYYEGGLPETVADFTRLVSQIKEGTR